ncbi:hypothetical protein C8R47DRAFT_1078238 [Mycena vitilis]|nr:hypothetical protein C8R47DRAFT_1078238 [Mycena vitilis]
MHLRAFRWLSVHKGPSQLIKTNTTNSRDEDNISANNLNYAHPWRFTVHASRAPALSINTAPLDRRRERAALPAERYLPFLENFRNRPPDTGIVSKGCPERNIDIRGCVETVEAGGGRNECRKRHPLLLLPPHVYASASSTPQLHTPVTLPTLTIELAPLSNPQRRWGIRYADFQLGRVPLLPPRFYATYPPAGASAPFVHLASRIGLKPEAVALLAPVGRPQPLLHPPPPPVQPVAYTRRFGHRGCWRSASLGSAAAVPPALHAFWFRHRAAAPAPRTPQWGASVASATFRAGAARFWGPLRQYRLRCAPFGFGTAPRLAPPPPAPVRHSGGPRSHRLPFALVQRDSGVRCGSTACAARLLVSAPRPGSRRRPRPPYATVGGLGRIGYLSRWCSASLGSAAAVPPALRAFWFRHRAPARAAGPGPRTPQRRASVASATLRAGAARVWGSPGPLFF